MNPTIKIKIDICPKEREYNGLPFGRKIDYRKTIQEFQATAQTVHISQKRRSFTAAWREFMQLYKPKQYYAMVNDQPTYRDDSFQVWYK